LKNPYTFSVISKIFGVLVGLLFTIFQSRYLGAEIKGQVATVNSIVSITSIIFGLGIYHAYPYFKRNSDTDVMPVFLKISLLLLAVYTAISAIALLSFQLSPKNVAVFIITPLLAYDGIVSYITLIEVPNKRSATDMAVNLAELVLLIILWIVAPPSFVIGVIVITVKDVVKALIFTFWWRKRIFVPSESIRIWIPRLVKFGFFPMLSLLMTTLNYRVDVLMLNGRVTDAAIGVYSVGVLLAERIWMIPDAMKGVMVSHIAKGKDANETANVIRICNTVCLVIILGIVALGKPFIDIAFGAEYNGAYQVTLILLAGVFSMIYYKLIASYNIAMGKQIVSFVLLSVGVVCNVIANLILIPMLGIYGAGIASVISYAICSMLFIVYFCRTTKIPFRRMLFIDRADYVRVKKWLKRK
jgi:O-antigen/teichoic acid export membrane protein